MRRFCVMGNPIAHSRSPEIHQSFAAQFGHEMSYSKRLIAPPSFARAVAQEFKHGLAGANVTVPFKQHARSLSTQLTPEALQSGAVNTLIPLPAGGLLGANTDGAGLISDIERQGIDIAGRRLIILGAGGAARGVLPTLIGARPEVIWVANRTVGKALELESEVYNVRAVERWQDVSTADVIINATSASLSGRLPEIPSRLLRDAQFVYDMMYGPKITPFLAHCDMHCDALLSDGLGMLVGQAAESYRLWWQCELPQVTPVIEQLKKALSSH